MLRFGPDTGSIAIMALPLFEEANRTRAFAIAICRALAARGVASILPDMPGQGESMVPLETVTIDTLRSAHRALVDRLCAGSRHAYALAIRSGALLDVDSAVFGRWALAPQDGSALLRELTRMRRAALPPKAPLGDDWPVDLIDEHGDDVSVEIAGNVIGPGLLNGLASSSPRLPRSLPNRIVRLSKEERPSDAVIEGTPLWRRSEPGNDIVLAQRLAVDIADWIAACEG